MKLHFIPFALVIIMCLYACEGSKNESPNEKIDSSKIEKMPVAGVDTSTHSMPDSATFAQKWKEFSTPGDMHKLLEKLNGTWSSEVQTWMDESAPPAKAKATNIQTSSFGGRYFNTKFNSSMMGQPFEGASVTGYDNAKKKFVSVWYDNMGTGLVHMEGDYDETNKTFSWNGTQTDFLTGKNTSIREVMVIKDDKTYTMTMYGPGADGKEMKFMEGTFTKK
jgi:hypothetical protein